MDDKKESLGPQDFANRVLEALEGADTETLSTLLAAVAGYWYAHCSRVELLGWLQLESRLVLDGTVFSVRTRDSSELWGNPN